MHTTLIYIIFLDMDMDIFIFLFWSSYLLLLQKTLDPNFKTFFGVECLNCLLPIESLVTLVSQTIFHFKYFWSAQHSQEDKMELSEPASQNKIDSG